MAEAKESTVWVSYDLGVRGDYEGLYAWLDRYHAKECGDSLAVLKYPYSDGKIAQAIERDLKQSISFDKRTRIYVIYRDRVTDLLKGKFILGNRRAAPWEGFAGAEEGVTDEEA